MPPRKIKTATGSSKPKAARNAKAIPKTAKKNAAAAFRPLSKTSKKRPAPGPEPELIPIPEYDLIVRSQHARDRSRFRLTRASLYDESINERSISERWEKLPSGSLSKITFGLPDELPIYGTKKRKTGSILRRGGSGLRSGSSMTFAEMMEDMRPAPRVIIPNGPDTSCLLRIPLEIRERIYAYLLLYPKPILVKHDLLTVERNPYISHGIMYTCKQIANEASQFLYKNNTFQTLLRKSPKSYTLYQETFKIDSAFHKYMRNVIIECSKDSWDLNWFAKASECIGKLVEARAVVDILTLVVMPQHVGMSSTALGMVSNPITFADFLWHEGAFINAIRKLSPKEFNITIKKDGGKRISLSLNLKYLSSAPREEGVLANAETLALASSRADVVDEQFRALKGRFEEVFVDDELAVALGRCRLLSSRGVPAESGQAPRQLS